MVFEVGSGKDCVLSNAYNALPHTPTETYLLRFSGQAPARPSETRCNQFRESALDGQNISPKVVDAEPKRSLKARPQRRISCRFGKRGLAKQL